MIGRLRIPGVWTWSAWQPDRGMAFNSYLFERGSGSVVVDPLPLDEDSLAQVERMGGIHTIVLTNRDHRRAAGELRERLRARILAHAPEAPLFDIPIDATFNDGDEVFGGAIALALEHGKTPGEVALHFPEFRAALVGDAIVGAPAGSLSLMPDEKLADPRRLVLELRRLWALRLDALLLCDGQPVLSGADDALAMLLETRGGAEVNRINADEIAYKYEEPHPGYARSDGEVGQLIGARGLGYRLARIPPGKAFCPLHSHLVEEEFFYVVEGEPTIRTLRGNLRCRPGDFIAFPTGVRGTHQLKNDSSSDCLVLMVGLNAAQEVCLYPDSEKLLADAPGMARMVRAQPLLDYWEGE